MTQLWGGGGGCGCGGVLSYVPLRQWTMTWEVQLEEYTLMLTDTSLSPLIYVWLWQSRVKKQKCVCSGHKIMQQECSTLPDDVMSCWKFNEIKLFLQTICRGHIKLKREAVCLSSQSCYANNAKFVHYCCIFVRFYVTITYKTVLLYNIFIISHLWLAYLILHRSCFFISDTCTKTRSFYLVNKAWLWCSGP